MSAGACRPSQSSLWGHQARLGRPWCLRLHEGEHFLDVPISAHFVGILRDYLDFLFEAACKAVHNHSGLHDLMSWPRCIDLKNCGCVILVWLASVNSSLVQEILSLQGDPDAPQCGFSNMACRILDAYSTSATSSTVFSQHGIPSF